MPQLRKRKTEEIVSDNIGKKERKGSPVILSHSKKKDSKTSLSKKNNKVKESKRSSNLKQKKNVSYISSDEESLRDNSFQGENVSETFSSPRKDPKIGKAKVVLNHVHIKEENSNSENALHNSVNQEIFSKTSDLHVTESKCDILKIEPSLDLSDSNQQCKNESSSGESEWEEVEDHCETSLDDYKPDIPKEGVEITIECSDLRIRKRKKKQFDENEWIRLHINRVRKDIQLSIHKTHLLCLLAHGIYVNKVLNCDSVKAIALSLIPSDILSITSGKKVDKIDISGIEKIMSWFCDTFAFENDKCLFLNIFSSMVKSFVNKRSENASEYNLMFIAIARILGFKVRFCVSLYPITHKASNLIKKPNIKKIKKAVPDEETKAEERKEPQKSKKEVEKEPKKHQKEKVKLKKTKTQTVSKKDKVSITEPKKKTSERISRPRRSTGKNYKLSSDEGDDSDDQDFEMDDDQSGDDNAPSTSKRTPRNKSSKKPSNRKVLSSDSEPSSPLQSPLESGNVICWAEVYSKPDKQWISVECSHNIINKPYDIEALTPQPVSYILAFDNESYVKDVTRRYCNDYMTATIKLRVDPEWWEDTLEPFLPPNSAQNKAEEKKLDEILVNKPLPTTIQGFKNHPLYALKRHLLKFEAIYPPDAPPVGFMRSEPVYARDCVHQLHSRETWLKEARVVRIGEEPYKIVKARPKWDRIAGVMKTDLPLEIFGLWQTEPYEPPIAVNGKVPRNEYGNVELFKPCMLPRGTVHLQLPGLNRIAKKLGIDCSAAVVGFDGHKGSVHPVYDGFVICEEFKDTILAAWDEEQENARKREEEKREKRIYGNWKKLIKGLLIRERIKLKYDVK